MPRRSKSWSGKRKPQPRKPPEGLLLLERFDEADLSRWKVASRQLDELHAQLHYGMESQRSARHAELIEALRDQRAAPFHFDGWYRALPYRYSLSPLSAAGSLRGVGGRFNIGLDLKAAGHAPWPALYLAQSFETAFREKFGLKKNTHVDGLTAEELALTSTGSFSAVTLRGTFNSVFDVGDAGALAPFMSIIKSFKIPRRVFEIQRHLGMGAGRTVLMRTPADLQEWVLERNWRVMPTQFDLPAPSQVLGRLLLQAGFEAIAYPSSKNGDRCLAVLVDNLRESESFVELDQAYPVEVTHPRLDRESAEALSR